MVYFPIINYNFTLTCPDGPSVLQPNMQLDQRVSELQTVRLPGLIHRMGTMGKAVAPPICTYTFTTHYVC